MSIDITGHLLAVTERAVLLKTDWPSGTSSSGRDGHHNYRS